MASGSEFTRPVRRFLGSLKKHITRYGADRLNIPEDAVRNLSSFASLSGPATGGFPTELLPLGASMWSGFILTPFAQQQMEGWVLPYWLLRQSLPSSGSFVPHGHAFVHPNMTHRNWTGVGLAGFPEESAVDPRGLLTPWPFGPSIDFWVKAGPHLFCPSEVDSVDQYLLDDLPIVVTRFSAGPVSCSVTVFMAPLESIPVVAGRIVLESSGGETRAELVLSVRPYNGESIQAVNEVSYQPRTRTFNADGNMLLYLAAEPDEVLVSDYIHGDVAGLIRNRERARLPDGTVEVREPAGLATAAALYDLDVAQDRPFEVCFACPVSSGTGPSLDKVLPVGNASLIVDRELTRQRESWKKISSEGMRVKVSDERYQKAFDVNKTFLLLMYDGRSITPGISTYHMMWFRDAAYLVPALERMGHAEKATPILNTYPDRQTPEGFFRSHNGEWDSNGQAIWTLEHHFRMTRDAGFLSGIYPSIVKGVQWIDSMRQTDLPPRDPRYGLLPPGISAEHFGINDCYYWDDIWAVGGLRAAARCARELGFKRDSAYADGLADRLMADMESSWEKAYRRLGRELIPIAPDRDIDSAAVGCVAAVYPLELLDPGNRAMRNTVSEIVKRCFYLDTHYHGIMHCGINPYLSMHVAQYYLLLREEYGLDIFESLWSMATGTYTYPEAINPLTGGGAYGDGHDGWCAGDIFNFVRNLFVHEEGATLALLPLSRRDWFEPGDTLEVENAPTFFGDISYRACASNDSVDFELEGDIKRPPDLIDIGVPFQVESVEVDGNPAETAGGRVAVPPSSRRVVFRVSR